MSYLLDTNVISELVKPKPTPTVLDWFKTIPDQALYISVLTLGEIRKGVENIPNSDRKEKLRLWLEIELIDWFGDRILLIDHGIADRWGRLQNEMKRPIPAIDSLIAATALHHDFGLVTRNIADYDYPSLQLINPWN